jgi:hypothetical protein
MAKKKTEKTDRKPIGVCFECGELAYRRQPLVQKSKTGEMVEVQAPYCHRHAQIIYRRRLKGLSPEVVYERTTRKDIPDEELRKIVALREAKLTLRQIGKALDISHYTVRERLAEADERFGNE